MVALLEHETVGAAAEAVGVSRRTLERWANDATFSTAVRDAQDMATRQAARRLAGGLAAAVKHMIHLAEHAEDEGVRLRACSAVVDAAVRLREHADLADRITGLETAVRGMKA